MTPETASKWRKIFLVLVIVFDVLMLICWWFGGHEVFFWVFIGINFLVIFGELINTLWVYKKTLSTQVTKTLEQGGVKAVFSAAAVVCMLATMTALTFHLLLYVKPQIIQ